MTAPIHAHLQTSWSQARVFDTMPKKLKKNNLPDLDLGNGNSWGIFKVLPPTTRNTTTETTISHSTVSPHQTQPPHPDLGPQDEPETELFATPQRKPAPAPTPNPTPTPTPTQSPAHPQAAHQNHNDLTDSEIDDQSLRHRDGYDLEPKTYGIRLFAAESSRYKHLKQTTTGTRNNTQPRSREWELLGNLQSSPTNHTQHNHRNYHLTLPIRPPAHRTSQRLNFRHTTEKTSTSTNTKPNTNSYTNTVTCTPKHPQAVTTAPKTTSRQRWGHRHLVLDEDPPDKSKKLKIPVLRPPARTTLI
ncbi:probable serine/threonine-protein kinase mkcB [Penaeus monodon]|uniref:probable serine/threonine-protein kinase mkcB n=1 Tax=Penaeus monodon TaxID=6687 RepID=UPI0018A7C64F|nr:probable serine/threonine-protein kinase mkcB [Penaeus monodon]